MLPLCPITILDGSSAIDLVLNDDFMRETECIIWTDMNMSFSLFYLSVRRIQTAISQAASTRLRAARSVMPGCDTTYATSTAGCPTRSGTRAVRVRRRPPGENPVHARGDARPDDDGELERIRTPSQTGDGNGPSCPRFPRVAGWPEPQESQPT